VRPEHLEQALRALPALGFRGCNLTLPHKQAALAIVDKLEPLARRIGAVNTIIVMPDGSLEGRNTDAFGFRENLRERAPDWQPPERPDDAVQQVHCHQHAVLGHEADDALLGLAGIRVRRASGCCGLAGSFGYQRGHEELSAALAQRSLVPAIRAMPGALVLADGFSCRQQIAQTTGRRALHLAELLDRGIRRGQPLVER